VLTENEISFFVWDDGSDDDVWTFLTHSSTRATAGEQNVQAEKNPEIVTVQHRDRRVSDASN
jgi:hypothetical protein